MSTSSGRILSNKHPHVMRETSRSSRQSDHSLAAVHSRGGDATSRWFLHVGWWPWELQISPQLQNGLGQCFESSHEGYKGCCPPSWSSLSSCLGVRSFEAHLENKWNNQWGPWGPAEIVSLMLILKVWRAYDAQTCPDYLPPELRLWNEVSNAIS